ncbi:MAG: DUF2868 domain-containing protein, partial [Myxococcota bacterium]|nr:DUF2868 domain-containing protein [Myxococcota bacterium]
MTRRREGEARPGALRPTLADWIDLLVFLHRDEERPDATLRRRDRAIGRTLTHLEGRPTEKLVAWVHAMRRIDRRGAVEPPGPGTAEAVRLAGLGLAALGLVLGASAALGAFAYQPQGRINAVAVLGTLVGIPALLLLFALLNALPSGLRRVLPWIGREPEGGGILQPARLAIRLLPPRTRATLAQAWGRGRGLERLTAPVQRWLLLRASQGAAVAFQGGALATAVALVVFTDLAFGWSTTLEVEPERVHELTSLLSAPWARFWPAARPSLELVEATRFFRIAGEPDPSLPLVTYGAWWPFVVTCMAVYGLLPRLVFLGVARRRLRRALARALREAPGSARVLDRLEDPLVETTAADTELGRTKAEADGTEAAPAGIPLPDRVALLEWAEALSGCEPREALGSAVVAFHEAGGRLGPDADAHAAEAVAAAATRE